MTDVAGMPRAAAQTGLSPALPQRAAALLDFWFGPPDAPGPEQRRQIWFRSTPEFDETVRRHFERDHEQASAGALDPWEATAAGALALLLLLDQVPRNIFRGTPRAYATDPAARIVADRALAGGHDRLVPPVWRIFFYLPFEHSEAIADQRRGLALFAGLPVDPAHPDMMRKVRRHLEIIERFGRFPHRNLILGRASTPAETAFLGEPESSF